MANFANKIEQSWYKPVGMLAALLMPLSALYWFISKVRLLLFKIGLIKVYRAPVPVIVIGNISVGGNGKTPMAIMLSKYLNDRGKRVAIISRGYGHNAPYTPYIVDAHSDPSIAGDEPVLLAKRTGVPVVIGSDRKQSIEKLMSEHQIDVIISDDGLQHYKLARDIELCVIDAQRQFGNGFLMPAGPLREGKGRLNTVDLCVYNGGAQNQASYQLAPLGFYHVKDDMPMVGRLPDGVAISAIGNPARFEQSLEHQGVEITNRVHFRDHHSYTQADFAAYENQAIYMTEKDAVKCRAFAPPQCYYLAVKAVANEQLNFELEQLLTKKGII